MNRFAYLATGQMITLLESLSRIRVIIHNQEQIPADSVIFVINHFTRIETLLLPYHIYKLTGIPVWSLADDSFFGGPFSGVLDQLGVVSTRDPDRDRLMVKSLLTSEANWIIFPEGRMVKDKSYGTKSRFLDLFSLERSPQAHTGAATLALRTEFYRQRLRRLIDDSPGEAARLQDLFEIERIGPVITGKTWLVPVNITYYPLRSRENILSRMAENFIGADISEQLWEEMLTEGTMLFEGVDIDIHFGRPLDTGECLTHPLIQRDMFSPDRVNFDDLLPSRQLMRREATGLMQRYMAAIYQMTTVNHDHLFSSLLKAMPFRQTSEENFRRKVFLLAHRGLSTTGVFRHQSLETDQTSLLTDDRYHKYRDFSALAQETGIARVENGELIKDPVKFSSFLNVHRARMENPLGVVANEVGPLKNLQRQVLKMAWLPEMLVRHQVADSLIQRADAEFAADYEATYLPGETKERGVGAPVLLRGRSRELGVVLVHGFLAAPREMAELAAYLNSRGLWVYLVRLKGHGTSPEDLASRTGKDWVESVDAGYALMSALCRRVVVGGFSFGGGLALDCAIRVPKVAGVFAVCPPLRLMDLSTRMAPAVLAWNRLMDILTFQGGQKTFVEISPEHPHINYHRLPVKGITELELFMRQLKAKLPRLVAPTLIAQADEDPVVNPVGSKILFEEIGSKHKSYRSFHFNRHGILLGEGADRVHEVIGEFIEGVRKAPETAASFSQLHDVALCAEKEQK